MRGARPRRRPRRCLTAAPLPRCLTAAPKAPQAPQRKRQRNSTNSSSPTYPHLPKRPHAANTQHLGKEQKGASPQCVIARRSAYNPTERRYPPAGAESDGSRRVFHAVPHDWHHLNKSRKRKCGQQKPETSLYLASIVRGVPREKARREPVVSAPPTPRRCPPAAPLPSRCSPAASPLPRYSAASFSFFFSFHYTSFPSPFFYTFPTKNAIISPLSKETIEN